MTSPQKSSEVQAATSRGVHTRLADLGPPGRVVGARGGVPDYRPGRTLRLWVETGRQLRRRRTQFVAALILLLPVLIALAFTAGGGNESSGSAFVDTAKVGAANFALFTEFASVGFLLVVMVALFCGDSVASEASWSSLRYLLAMPVPRSRLLRQKLLVALGFSALANLLLPAWAFVVGGLFFGWAPARLPSGSTFDLPTTLGRFALVVAYVFGQMLLVAAVAFLLSVLTDAPLGAVGGAVSLVVVSNIMDTITALGDWRQVLPTHFQYQWVDLLGSDIEWGEMTKGAVLSASYSSVLLALAWWRFCRKDITS